jgi:Tat protein secretion system quality control protein TatD with DNase activity
MHCFSGKFRLIERIIENKWYLSIPTNIKNSHHFQKLAKECPLEQLFCETDSLFLHPDKLRNNTPGNVIESYKKISEMKNILLEKVEKQLEINYNNIFK